ncbi:helix-turn-helix transcriptional regulator [Segniliparus rugosus]|uniref:HTH cro/C1-type domain-containing protein n=1 Tax=Segniliparus rugosus (strain ATCC BAA-974 / DSM 45345 / CCUG 50838 / CIP 108380 / JCM 13579 / CDC 945) TaxID=679197 RepID=E5XLR4_SEGRC|nr:helix-turn-helix transcriptional regulator [Segniliparus rugosus]EFV14742.1 hypothetical protein HMPREF9336_00433 [Segniliparus rugosus ATCC BAA-974]
MADDQDQNFARQVQQLREEQGLTQGALARKLRERGLAFHQTTVQRLESGERPAKLGEAFVIAEVLGSTVEAMISTPKATVEAKVQASLEQVRRASRLLLLTVRGPWEAWQEAAANAATTWEEGQADLISELPKGELTSTRMPPDTLFEFLSLNPTRDLFAKAMERMEQCAKGEPIAFPEQESPDAEEGDS